MSDTQTKQRIADNIVRALTLLQNELGIAADEGLEVEISVVDVTAFGDKARRSLVTARIFEKHEFTPQGLRQLNR